MGHHTFPQFINRILSEWRTSKTANEHWRPYYINCDYCDIKYDFIGRVETFEKDLDFVSQIANFEIESLPPNALHYHPSGSDERYAVPKKLSQEEKDTKVKNYFEPSLSNLTFQISFQIYSCVSGTSSMCS